MIKPIMMINCNQNDHLFDFFPCLAHSVGVVNILRIWPQASVLCTLPAEVWKERWQGLFQDSDRGWRHYSCWICSLDVFGFISLTSLQSPLTFGTPSMFICVFMETIQWRGQHHAPLSAIYRFPHALHISQPSFLVSVDQADLQLRLTLQIILL